MIRSLLIFLALSLVFACTEQETSNTAQDSSESENIASIVTYLYDKEDAISLEYAAQVSKALDYTKIPFRSLEVKNFTTSIDMSMTRVILVNSTMNFTNDQVDLLLKFVSEGGTLIFPTVNEDTRVGYLSGIISSADYDFNLESKGITFTSDFLPQMRGRTIYSKRLITGLSGRNFKSTIDVHATSFTNPKMPTILSNKIGEGKVFLFNTTLDLEKEDRGLFFSAILEGLEGIPYPIPSLGAIFIDDFPKPLYSIKSPPIDKEFDLDQAQFTLDIWWPDMLKLADKHKLVYSAYPCFNYNQIKRSPYLFAEWDLHKSVKKGKNVSSASWVTKQLAPQNVELGIHGYNHESLLSEIWEQGRDIENSFLATRKKWTINNFGSFPTSYVAPSNEIDSFGLAHLSRSMPEIRYMSTVYTGDIVEGGDREFDVDPYNSQFFDFPRLTSGYVMESDKVYAMQSTYLFTGIWTHFIHPDDVYQLPDISNTSAGKYGYRNELKLGWRKTNKTEPGMLDYFDQYLTDMGKTYPGLRYLDVTEAGEVTEDWRNSEYTYKLQGDFFRVEKISTNNWKHPDYYWFLYLNAKTKESVIKSLKESVLNVWDTPLRDGYLLTLKTAQPSLDLTAIAKKTSDSNASRNVYQKVKEEMLAHQKAQVGIVEIEEEISNNEEEDASYTSEEDKVIDTLAWYVGKDRYDLAINYIERKIVADEKLNLDLFRDHVEYAGYSKNEFASWDLAEKMFVIEAQLGLGYHDYLRQTSEYPNDEIAKIWLQRYLAIYPEDKKAQLAYSQLLDEDELEELYESDDYRNSSKEFYAQYIQYLLENQPDRIKSELQSKNPGDWGVLWPLATAITYNYADRAIYTSALEWAEFSNEIPIITRLQWWADLEAFENMDETAKKYLEENGANDSVSLFVANAWYDYGQPDRGTFHANKVRNESMKNSFSSRLNNDVRFFEADTKKYLISELPKMIDEDTIRSIKRDLRISENNYFDYQSSFVIDNFNQSNWDNRFSFNLRDRHPWTHSIALLHSEVSDLNLLEVDPDNISHTLLGASYRFTSVENSPKPVFRIEAGVLGDDRSNIFGTFNTSIQHSKVTAFKSLTFTFDPVKTGPGLSRNIYKADLIGYYEKGATEFLQPSIAFNASSYTNSVSELALTGKLFFNLNRKNYSRFSPFAEAFGSVANANVENGNPYWIIDNRLYAGGGLAWTYGRGNIRKFNARLEGGIFADSYTDYFVRLNGTFSVPVNDFTYLTGSFELFNQAQYYSNGFGVGLRHYLKRKKPYSYKRRFF